MIDPRLELALNGGGLDLPDEGVIAVFQPPVEADLADLPPCPFYTSDAAHRRTK